MASPRWNPFRRIGAALLGTLLLFAWGCSRSVTSPVPEEKAPARASFARTVMPADLDGADAGGDDLAAVMQDQPAVEIALRGRVPRLAGTAVSRLHGRPVVLALTREAEANLPDRVAGREVAQLVVGDVTAQSYYCGTSTGENDVCNAGTLGAIVTDGTRNYWLSNWHVFARINPLVGDAVVSPGRADAGCGASTAVGTLSCSGRDWRG
jgi:hypothetical protein